MSIANERPRLGADDWVRAALDVMVEEGIAGVKVPRLCERLGVTKGSFYWHFEDRAALIAAALDEWERSATTALIEWLDRVDDPIERLHALFTVSFADQEHGPLDAALVVRADDSVVGPVVRRVAEQRVAFLERLFRQTGLPPAKARMRAREGYSTYVGHFHVRRALVDDRDLDGPSPAYLRQLIATLTAP
jgi:AcrR family transcriptional regulator